MPSPSRSTSQEIPPIGPLFVTRLFEAADCIAIYPQAGRVIPEIADDDRREVFVGPYRIMYRNVKDEVWITAIVHGARDWPNPPQPPLT